VRSRLCAVPLAARSDLGLLPRLRGESCAGHRARLRCLGPKTVGSPPAVRFRRRGLGGPPSTPTKTRNGPDLVACEGGEMGESFGEPGGGKDGAPPKAYPSDPLEGAGHGASRPGGRHVLTAALRLTSEAVVVVVEPVGVGRQHLEVPIRDLRAIKVRRRRRDAHGRTFGPSPERRG
jgi:hypothetical protein